MALAKKQFAFLALFVSLFIILISVLILDSVLANEKLETKAKTVSLLSEPYISDSLFLFSSNNEKQVKELILPEIKADFVFNGFGLRFVSASDNYDFYAKTENSDWLLVKNFREPVFLSGQIISVKIVAREGFVQLADFTNLELIYFNTEQERIFNPRKAISSVYRKITNNQEEVKIISREEWGANEDYRFWEPQYADPVAFVMHHTAGGDGADDPEATIRGIYYWHAVVLGWGDIGYNYLVDPQGNIYEGRYGGDKVIGAHTYNNISDMNYNEGTVGISVLGCYENVANDCYVVNEYNDNIQEAVADLVADKAIKLNIPLSGDRVLLDQIIPSIVGHQDLDYTLCPGNILEEQLPNLISYASEKYNELVRGNQYRATLVSQNFLPAYFINSAVNPVVTYKNTGDLPWLNNKVYLKVRDSLAKKTSRYYLTSDIQPKETVDFNISWQAPAKPGQQRLTLKLFHKNKYISHSRKYIQIRVDNPNQAKLKKHNLPMAALASWDPSIAIKYDNTGIIPWSKNNTDLYINGQKITTLKEQAVTPQKTGSFDFSLLDIDNLKTGTNKLVVLLKQDNLTIKDSRFVWLLRID